MTREVGRGRHRIRNRRRVGVASSGFRLLWVAWSVSLVGDGVRALALPLFVAVTTRSPLAASAVTAAEVVPWLLVALPAGALVDRFSPKRVVLIAHVARGMLTAGMVIAIATGAAGVPMLCVFAFLLTLGETFAYPASQAMLVELAGPDELTEANSRFFMAHTVGLNLVGPLAAGAIFVLGPELAFALDALTFVLAAALVAGLGPVGTPRQRSTGRGLLRDIRLGAALLAQVPALRSLVLTVAATAIGVSAVNAMTPLYAVARLHMSPPLVSWLLVVGALGALLATVGVPRLTRTRRDGPVLLASLLLLSVGMILFGAVPLVATALVANMVIGLGIGTWNVLSAARRQRLTPPGAMGRVSGAYRMVAWGLMPIGAGLAGPLAVATSLGAVFVASGALVAVMLLAVGASLARPAVTVPAPRTELNPADRTGP